MMDPNTKEFMPLTEETDTAERLNWPRFKVGEIHTLNGIKMKVRKVTKKDVVLRPV